ncbi:hypothetical protein [Urinicoccus massiliensis]|uniref:hypothetical protein n=1 Tax=Urinicoccus massiliensis TaxID=1723382 RepID=UPI0009308643|nr:hypothetical protein [Urinicoccus massiliensis]
MTDKQVHFEERLESTFSVWKSSFLTILLACLLAGLLTAGSQQLSYQLFPSTNPKVLVERQLEENKKAIDQGNIDVNWGLGLGSKVKLSVANLSILVGPLANMVSAGLFVAIYKRVLEGKQAQVGDIFIFFKKNFPRNYLICFLVNLISTLLSALYMIPAMIFGIYMFFWPLALYKGLDGNGLSVSKFFKDSLAESNGERGTIFAKFFKYGFIVFVVVFILSFAVLMATASSGSMGGLVGLGAGLIAALIMVVVEPFIYLAYIEVFLERKKLVLERQRIQDQLMADQAPQDQDENLNPEVEEEKPQVKPYDQGIHSDFD